MLLDTLKTMLSVYGPAGREGKVAEALGVKGMDRASEDYITAREIALAASCGAHVHICHVFSVIDRIPYSMDLALVKRVAEFADNVCPPVEDHFCESGAYCVDKIIWMICSKGKKKELLKVLAEMTQ